MSSAFQPYSSLPQSVVDAPGLRRAAGTLAAMAGAGLVVLAPLVILRPELLDLVQTVVDLTLSKGESESFVERQAMNELAWNAVAQSWGLGIGWGSTRSSSSCRV